MLYYSIAHYFDVTSCRMKNKYNNIKRHMHSFLDIKQEQKEFILVSFIDTPREDKCYKDIKKHLEEFCQEHLPNNKVKVIIEYNWGGTIAALWYTYIFLETLQKDGYVAHFEEDFGPKNSEWYNKSIDLLTKDMIYVGESNIGRIKHEDDDKRLTAAVYSQQPRLGIPEVWTDGGFYFSTVKKLKKIKEKIGIFHKGDQNKKYQQINDGISIGEVGFPTLLYHNRFNFSVLNRNDYFINEWNG